jgi:uncharacterized protein YeaO (DUF488 family)
MAIQLKRAYDTPSALDGKRVLVDRLWPRGVSKSMARIDLWLRELAPSTGLRKWFHHQPEYFPLFRKRYLKELSTPKAAAALEQLYALARHASTLSLIYAAKNETHNNATVLKELLEGMRKPPSSSGPARAAAARAQRRMPKSRM